MMEYPLLACLASSRGRFLLNSCSNILEYPLMTALPRPVVVSIECLFKYDGISSPGCLASSCGRVIQIGWNILSWLLWLFLIEFLFKYDGIRSPGCLASSRGRF